MKLHTTLLLALMISAGPVKQTVASFSISRTAPRPLLFNMDSKTVLKRVGIGVAVVGIGYLIYHFCLRKHTDQELAFEINRIDNDELVGELRVNGANHEAILRRHGWKDPSTRTAWYKRETDSNYLEAGVSRRAPLLRGTAILEEIIKNKEKYKSKFLERVNTHTTSLSQDQITTTRNQLHSLDGLDQIYDNITSSEQYRREEAAFNKHLDKIEAMDRRTRATEHSSSLLTALVVNSLLKNNS